MDNFLVLAGPEVILAPVSEEFRIEIKLWHELFVVTEVRIAAAVLVRK